MSQALASRGFGAELDRGGQNAQLRGHWAYEPGELTPARQNTGAVSSVRTAGAGQALRCAGGSAPARRPTPIRVTSVNGITGDICIGLTHF
jgi:hypothetical protein